MLSELCPNETLDPLIYPFVEVTLGTIKYVALHFCLVSHSEHWQLGSVKLVFLGQLLISGRGEAETFRVINFPFYVHCK